MKATGVVRKIDELGRIVLPKEIRDRYRWEVGTPLEIYVEGETVVLQKYDPIPDVETEIERLIYSLRNDNAAKHSEVIFGLEEVLRISKK